MRAAVVSWTRAKGRVWVGSAWCPERRTVRKASRQRWTWLAVQSVISAPWSTVAQGWAKAMRVRCPKVSGRWTMRRRESRALVKLSSTWGAFSAVAERVRFAPRQRVTVPIGRAWLLNSSGVVLPEVSKARHFLMLSTWPVSAPK